MSLDEVLAAFPGEAKRIDPELKLADGATVSAGIDDFMVADQLFHVRFVFQGGKLALVSLRTPPERYAGTDVFDAIEKELTAALGDERERSSDTELVELRQTRWRLSHGAVDLKYIPGVVVILYHPPGA